MPSTDASGREAMSPPIPGLRFATSETIAIKTPDSPAFKTRYSTPFTPRLSQRRSLVLRLSSVRAHLRAMLHHLFVAHAAMLCRIMLSGIVATLRLMLLHYLAVPHHFL